MTSVIPLLSRFRRAGWRIALLATSLLLLTSLGAETGLPTNNPPVQFGGGFGGRSSRGGRGGRRGGGGGGGGTFVGNPADYLPPLPPELNWPINPAFKEDTFNFARLIYSSETGTTSDGYYRSGGNWSTDTPLAGGGEGDSDSNLAFRLHQMTSLKVQPGRTYITITPENLARHPFVYAVEPGRMVLRETEVTALRKYLLNGGFLMLDDNWGDAEWSNIRDQMRRIFPEHAPVELSLNHPIFHTIFDLKQKPQMPAIGIFLRGGQTWENNKTYQNESHDSHFFGIFDAKNRMMVLISHNNDFGDGWEREGDNYDYFKRFSEPMAYPMIINIIYYVMSH